MFRDHSLSAFYTDEQTFRIMIVKHANLLHEDMEVKGWHDGQPTAATAWQQIRGKGAKAANLQRQLVEISRQYVADGQALYSQALRIDSNVSQAETTILRVIRGETLMDLKIRQQHTRTSEVVVHLTKGRFRRERALPDRSIVAESRMTK